MKTPDVKSLFRASLFWDADQIDPVVHAPYVIGRVLDYGDKEDVRRLMQMYAREDIVAVIKTKKGLFPKTGKYWAVKFSIPLSEVPCLNKYYHKKP